MIEFEEVSITHSGSGMPVLRAVNLRIEEGELALVIGPTGVGKSTLLGAVNGLTPHFTGGTLSGDVRVGGKSTRTHRPRDLADVVGVVIQDPVASFVADNVEEELAYSMEQLGLPPATMRKRVEETLDLLGIVDLRDRPLHQLSGGQQQRVAIGAALTAQPAVLVLDEPTSALDPGAAEDVLASISRLVHDLGVTVVMAEHRLERVAHHADRVIEICRDGTVHDGSPSTVLVHAAVAPPVVHLGRLAGWDPLPLSVRDARRHVGPLRERLVAAPTDELPARRSSVQLALSASKIRVLYGTIVAVRDCDLNLHRAEIVALMGRNGSGKSSLLWALQGSGPRQAGSVKVDSLDPATLPPARARRIVSLVPQTASDLLYLDTVGAECDQADREADQPPGATRQILDQITPGIPQSRHPRDLSEGQRLALALAIQLVARPKVLLLDEPTRGLDYGAKESLVDTLRREAETGTAVAVATHDVEFAALVADRVVVMASGEILADGPATDLLVASPTLAPQIAKVLAPLPYLTIHDVHHALTDHARS